MDLRQLAALTAVAETGSFSAAARRLHTVQSNVSTHVARLEAELGAVLVDRATGTMTDEGEVVVARARRIHHELDSLRADVDSMLHEVSGAVRLGCIGTVGRWLVPRLLEGIAEQHPQVHVVVVDATTTSLQPQLVAETLDLAIVNLPVGTTELATEPLFDEDRIILAPLDHPLAAEATVEVRYTTSGVEIQVTDRGTGTPMPGEPGAGIAGMRERAESYDGQLTAGPEPDGGWRVHSTLCFAEATR